MPFYYSVRFGTYGRRWIGRTFRTTSEACIYTSKNGELRLAAAMPNKDDPYPYFGSATKKELQTPTPYGSFRLKIKQCQFTIMRVHKGLGASHDVLLDIQVSLRGTQIMPHNFVTAYVYGCGEWIEVDPHTLTRDDVRPEVRPLAQFLHTCKDLSVEDECVLAKWDYMQYVTCRPSNWSVFVNNDQPYEVSNSMKEVIN